MRAVLISLFMLGDAGPSGAATSTAGAPSLGPPGSSIAELSIDTGQADHLGDTTHYRYVLLQEYMYSHIAQIKRANPNTKVLAYLEAAATQRRGCGATSPPAYGPHDSFGVNFCYAETDHPEWFLHSASGQWLSYADYQRYMAMDVGNAGYQRTWADNAVAAARADGFDGIYLDDVNTYPGHGIDGRIAEYGDQAYGKAMASFATAVADRVRSNGLLVAANVAANPWIAWQRADGLSIAAQLSVYTREHYTRYGDICGPFSERFNTTADQGTPPIGELIAYDRAVQASGARLMGIDYGYSAPTANDLAAMTYGRAAFLLAWDGRVGSAYLYRPCGTVDPANPQWTVDLGTPTAPAVLTGAVYRRSFSDGLVFLNPSRDKTVTISIPAGYVDARGTIVSGATKLAPESALLLRRLP